MDVSDASSTLTSSNSDEFDEHNIWNPMWGLLFYVHVVVSLKPLFDEEDLGRMALSCHFCYVTKVRPDLINITSSGTIAIEVAVQIGTIASVSLIGY